MCALKLIGHRGYGPTHGLGWDHPNNQTAPENSLAAFEKALDSGADGIELDVLLSGDGVPVVIHDVDLSRHVQSLEDEMCVQGKVNFLTGKELENQDIGGGHTIPKLSDVFALCLKYQRSVYINLDIKDTRCVDPVLKVLDDFNDMAGHNVVVSSYKWHLLHAFRERSEKINLVPAMKSQILFGEDNVKMPGYIPMVDYYAEAGKRAVYKLHDEIGVAALDCTFTDFKDELVSWAEDLGVGLQISTGNARVKADDMPYETLSKLSDWAEKNAHIPFVVCKVDEPDKVRTKLDNFQNAKMPKPDGFSMT